MENRLDKHTFKVDPNFYSPSDKRNSKTKKII